MLSHNTSLFKLVVPMLLTLLLSACTNGFTNAKKTDSDTSQQAQQPVTTDTETNWEVAYGEKQEYQQNELGPVPVPAPLVIKQPSENPIIIEDVWQRIRLGYGIPHDNIHPKTQKQLDWFISHPEYVDRVVERARPYLHYIVEQVEQRDIPLEMALLPVVESGFQPFAYSKSRAAGLWQFIPSTGKLYGLKQNWWYDGRRDVVESTRAALDYLEKLHNDFGDWQLALAAYNCGEGTVSRAIKKNKKAGKKTDFWSLTLPAETSAYVPKLMAVAELVKQPEKFNITLKPIANTAYLAQVDVGSQIDLAVAAKMANISTDEIHQLNPGYNQWATMPEGPHKLVLPINKVAAFEHQLAEMPKEQRVQWAKHKIKPGESLGLIASKYQTSISAIKTANKLTSNNIRAGRHLLIPSAGATSASTPKAVKKARAAQLNTRTAKKGVYVVKKGDTWWDIARANNTSVRKLAALNNKSHRDVLRPGQKLLVEKAKPNKQGVNYTIKSGDSLWGISQRFNVSVAQVREWNGLSSRTLLQPGQNLTIYPDGT
jgi:membrane-bound lytic murein transglycosylase D